MLSPAEYYHTSQFGITELENPELARQRELARQNQVGQNFMDALDASNMRNILVTYASASPEQAERMFEGETEPYLELIQGRTPDQTHNVYKALGGFYAAQGDNSHLAQLIHHYTRFATIEVAQDINDQVAGLDHSERIQGNAKISNPLDRKIYRAARQLSGSVEEAVQLAYLVKTATHLPSLNLFHGYLANTNGDPQVRKVMMDVIEGQAHDIHLAAQKVQIMGKSVALRREVGMDTDSYLAAFGAQSVEFMRDRVMKVFTDPAFTDEYHRRLVICAPEAQEKLLRGENITFEEVLDERSARLKLPEEFPSQPDLEDSARKLQKTVADSTRLSVSKDGNEGKEYQGVRIIVPITSERAGNVIYKNTKGKDVETIALDPYRLKDVITQIGHEDGHKDHYAIATRMQKIKPETTISWEDNTHKETLAQIKGEAVAEVVAHPLQAGEELEGRDDIENFMRATRMGFTALNQLFVQEELDKLENPGDLSLDEARRIAQEAEVKMNELVQKTFGMPNLSHAGIANTLTPEFLLDGIVYTGMFEGLISQKITMSNVIEKRLGKQWWGTDDGQILYGYLGYLTTQGLNAAQCVETMLQVDVTEAKDELAGFGITLRPQEEAAA